LVQETFIRAYRFFPKFRGDSSVKTWLYKLALNTFRSHSRKRQAPPTEVPELVADPRDYASSSDTKMTVFDLLSITDRTLLTLRDLDDCSYAEIASVTGMSEDQVRVGLHRARKRFRMLYTEISKD
jgi:RNA polymerase sigma-70 factor (ECF subfamily)